MRDRSYRRHRQDVMRARAFEAYFHGWGWKRHAWEHFGPAYEPTIVDKWETQDANRAHVRSVANRVCNHMRVCSCALCTYRDRTKERALERAEFRDALENATAG